MLAKTRKEFFSEFQSALLEKRIARRLQEIEFRKHPEGRNLLDRNQRKIDALIEVVEAVCE